MFRIIFNQYCSFAFINFNLPIHFLFILLFHSTRHIISSAKTLRYTRNQGYKTVYLYHFLPSTLKFPNNLLFYKQTRVSSYLAYFSFLHPGQNCSPNHDFIKVRLLNYTTLEYHDFDQDYY